MTEQCCEYHNENCRDIEEACCMACPIWTKGVVGYRDAAVAPLALSLRALERAALNASVAARCHST